MEGCSRAVRSVLDQLKTFVQGTTHSIENLTQRLSICPDRFPEYALSNRTEFPPELLFIVEQTSAGLNMGNYPPGPETALS